MIKGFKDKNKKFHPTEKRNKSALKKSDIRRKRNVVTFGVSESGDVTGENLGADRSEQLKSLGGAGKKGGALVGKGLKGLGSFTKKKIQESDERKKADELEKKLRRERVELAINAILENQNTSLQTKFINLQDLGFDNNDILTDRQRKKINTNLKLIEKEAQAGTPSRFISAVQPKDSSSTSKKDKKKNRPQTTGTGTTAQPVTLLSGQQAIPTADEQALNQLRTSLLNPVSARPNEPVSSSTETISEQSDNKGAEINAILGR